MLIPETFGRRFATAQPLPGNTASADRTRPGDLVTHYAAPALLAGTVCFNAALAWASAHGIPVSTATVATCQAALVGLVLATVARVRPSGAAPWMIFLWVATLGFVLLSILRGQVQPRYLSDICTIPVFVMLGLGADPRRVALLLMGLQLALTGFALWELADPASFGATFDVSGYYVRTRGFDEDAFWAGQDLFLSSERPTGRLLLPGADLHRASSLFLEPVSLGNWTVVVTIALAVLQPVLRRAEFLFLLATNMVLLVACDGRLAMLINFLLLGNWFLAPRLPRFAPMAYLPGVLLLLGFAAAAGLLTEQGDTLLGRLRYGIDFLLSLDVSTLLGLYAGAKLLGADSGWSYFIATQSLFGLIALWAMLTLPPRFDTAASRRAISGTALFVSLSLPVSYSIFSIKTAAMLWVLHGVSLAATDARGRQPSRRRARAFEAPAKGPDHDHRDHIHRPGRDKHVDQA